MEVFYVLPAAQPTVNRTLLQKTRAYKEAYYKTLGEGYIYVFEKELTGKQLNEILSEKGKVKMLQVRVYATSPEDLEKLQKLNEELRKIKEPTRSQYREVPYSEETLSIEYYGILDILWKDEIDLKKVIETIDSSFLSYKLSADIKVGNSLIAMRNFELPIPEDERYVLAKRYPPYAAIKSDGTKVLVKNRKEIDLLLKKDPNVRVFINEGGEWKPAIIVAEDFRGKKLYIRSSKKNGISLLIDLEKDKIMILSGDPKVEKGEMIPISIDLYALYPHY